LASAGCEGKCSVVLEDEAWAPMCVAAGARQDGQSCTRADAPGRDDCAAGAFCTFYGVVPPALGGDRVCRVLCGGDAGCASASGDRCVDFGAGLEPAVGLCVPSCAPFSDCGAGLDCSQPDRDVEGGIFLYCRPLGVKALGAACDDGDAEKDECVAGAMCLDVEGTGDARCIALCDDAHVCTTGSCSVIAGAPGGAGYCAP